MLRLILKMVLRDFTNRKVRTILTIIGVSVGIATLVCLVSLTEGTMSQIESQLSELVDFMILPAQSFQRARVGAENVMDRAYLDYVKSFPEVKAAAGYLIGPAIIDGKFSIAIGVEPDMFTVVNANVTSGRMMRFDEKEILLGYGAAQNLEIEPGTIVKLQTSPQSPATEFKVVGVLDRTGGMLDAYIFMPLDIMEDLLGYEDKISIILVKLESPSLSSVFEGRVDSLFPNLEVNTPGAIMESINQIVGLLNAVLLVIGGVSLLVGMTSIAATMMTSVIEKTHEIGVMKALGASRRTILFIFLSQSLMICLFGGVLGIFISLGLASFIEKWTLTFQGFMIHAEFPPSLILGALSISELVGLLSGAIPAIKASNIPPAEALRYE